jgi:uncharacterized protein (TIGR02246 family)
MKCRVLILMPLVVAFAGCAPASEDTTEADVEAINQVVRDYARALNAEDTDGVVAVFADAAVHMPANSPALAGKEAIRSQFQAVFEQTAYDLTFAVVEVVVAGDWAFARTTVSGATTLITGGEPNQISSKTIFILQRQNDGSWKIGRYIFNSDNPVEGA